MKKLNLISNSFCLTILFAIVLLVPIAAQNTVEDEYWDLVKNSQKVSEFEGYLKEYPNGKYAAIARSKINGGKSSKANLFYGSSIAMTNEAFLERWETDLESRLPQKYGSVEIYRASSPSKKEDFFYVSGWTPGLNSSGDTKYFARTLNAELLADYCNSEAFQRNITIALWVSDNNKRNNYGSPLTPGHCAARNGRGNNPNPKTLPVSMELSLQSGIQEGANGRNRIPINQNDPAHTAQNLLWNPAIYVDVNFSDGTKIGPHDYHKTFAGNLIFDDVSGDPNDLIEVSWWDIDSSNPQSGKYAAQLGSTGKGTGVAYLKVSLRDTPSITASVKVEIVSGISQAPTGNSDIQFLNAWSAEVRVDLPELVGGYKLIDAKSWCPAGCDYSGASGSGSPHLRLIFDANPNHRRIPTKEIERTLKPILLQVYCKTESIQRNLNMNVVFQNRDVTPYNFWVYPRECS